MNNQELAKIFEEIAELLEMDEVPFKPQAYRKAARNIKSLEQDIGLIYKERGLDGLKEIPAIGENIAEKIKEFLQSGEVKYYQALKKKKPLNVGEIIRVEGMGPKRAEILYRKLRVANLEDLEKAALEGKISCLPGFGKKTEQNILESIEFLKKSKGRVLLGDILPEANRIQEELKSLKGVKKISVVGSVRRKKATIGDIDFLIAVENTENKKTTGEIMDYFTSMPGVIKIWGKGGTRSSVKLKQGFDVDLRVVAIDSFGAALQYFTGSKEHNIATRKIAKSKGLKLNEYGLFKGNKKIAGRTEEGIYQALGMEFIPPEIRENKGEISAALKGKLPKLIEQKDIKGDFHCHSVWDGGVDTIREMANRARELGYEYLGISDHTKFLRIENGLNEKQLKEQRKEIKEINSEFESKGLKFRVLQGCEANILKHGRLDIDSDALAQLDFVIAGIHSDFGMNREQMTKRLIRAIKNPHVNIISHPTGRLLKRREEIKLDFEAVLEAARESKVALEINSSPARLDLCGEKARMAKKAGVKLAVNTDAHSKTHLNLMEFGIAQARKGWAEKEDIVNCGSLNDVLDFFKK